jgi:hypothetical protein
MLFMSTTLSLVQPDTIVTDINAVIQHSYASAKKQFNDGVTVFRDELTAIYGKAENCISRMALPVNNFLKDLRQIDCELQLEIRKDILGAGLPDNVIPMTQPLASGFMEENY